MFYKDELEKRNIFSINKIIFPPDSSRPQHQIMETIMTLLMSQYQKEKILLAISDVQRCHEWQECCTGDLSIKLITLKATEIP